MSLVFNSLATKPAISELARALDKAGQGSLRIYFFFFLCFLFLTTGRSRVRGSLRNGKAPCDREISETFLRKLSWIVTHEMRLGWSPNQLLLASCDRVRDQPRFMPITETSIALTGSRTSGYFCSVRTDDFFRPKYAENFYIPGEKGSISSRYTTLLYFACNIHCGKI